MPRRDTFRTMQEWKEIKARKKMEARMTPEDREMEKMKNLEIARARHRDYVEKRRLKRQKDPILAEIDKLHHREIMRKYMARRRAIDPVFMEKCRISNKRSAAKRRIKAASQIEVDETEN